MEFNSGKLLKMLKLPYYNSGILDIDQTILGLFKYDLKITGEELIRSVGWKLGEIIDRLDYEEIHQRFDKDTTKAVLWQREFLPHSSCFSFQPPPTTNRSAQLVIKVREIKDFCSWYNEYRMMYFQYNIDCPYHNEFCTDEMTCIVSKTFEMEVFFFIESIVTNTQNLRIGSGSVFDSYKKGSKFTQMKFAFLNGEDSAENTDSCVKKCQYETIMFFYNCWPISPENLTKRVENLCTNLNTKIIIENREYCLLKHCQLPKYGTYWMQNGFDRPSYSTVHMVSLGSDLIQQLIEEEDYTIVNFLSDLGGNAGFFYGVSLLFLVMCIFDFIFKY